MGLHSVGGDVLGRCAFECELKLEVEDSPNSAGVAIDAIRSAKIADGQGIERCGGAGIGLLHEVAAGADAG